MLLCIIDKWKFVLYLHRSVVENRNFLLSKLFFLPSSASQTKVCSRMFRASIYTSNLISPPVCPLDKSTHQHNRIDCEVLVQNAVVFASGSV